MAGNKIEIDLSVEDKSGSLKKRTNEAKELNQELDRASKSIGGVGIPTGTRAGAQAMRASYSTSAAAERVSSDSTVGLQRTTVSTGFQRSGQQTTRQAAYSPTQGEMTDYTMAGGVTGRGGASARDFAAEAQGLGGLVRLYATYAANIFAVSAAFTALRESMATDIMIKGMEQLGAASGQSLGAMTKQFVTVTDGMISMREAAEAVTKASSSGLGRQQILELATVAKGASQALGVNMSDAVSRLSRGIVKLEPELLDELGLFTKTGKAAEDYARKVGKTESQLTDFERRQAFANAVLEEGRKKFGEIAQEGNPYDKLLASLKNVAQDILSIVNSIVGPIAKLLADNTGLITAAIGLAALKITQQAIPALGNWQKSMKASADRAKQEMGELNRVFSEGLVTRAQQEAGLPQLEKKLAEAKKELALQGGRGYLGKGYDPDEPRIRTAQQIALEEEKVNKHMERGNDLQKQKAMKAQAVLNIEKEILRIQGDINKAHDYTQNKMDAEAKIFSQTWMMEKNLQNARAKYESADIRSRVSQNVYEKGTFGAIGELAKETIASKNMSGLGKASTIALGGIQALTQGIGILFNALSRVFGYLGIAYTVFEILDSVFSTNSKSSAKFKDSLSQLEETTKTAIETNKKYEGSLSLEAAIAYANSFDGLTQSVRELTKSFTEFGQESSRWDKSLEWIKDILPFVDSLQEKLAKQMGKSIVASIESMPAGEGREAFRKQMGDLLNLQPGKLTAKNISNILEDADEDTINAVSASLEQMNKKVQESSLYLKGLKDSGDLAEKSMSTFMNSMKDSTPLTTFFVNTIKYSDELNKALNDANFNTQAAALDKLANTDLTIFGSQALEIQKVVLQFSELKTQAENSAKSLEASKDKLDELIKKRKEATGMTAGPLRAELDKQIIAERGIIQAQENAVADLQYKIKDLAKEAENFIKLSVGDQVNIILERFKDQLAKIRLETQKDVVSKGFGDTISGTQALGDIAKQQIAVEERLITSQDRLADKLDLLRIQLAEEKGKATAAGQAGGAMMSEGVDPSKVLAAQEQARAMYEKFMVKGDQLDSSSMKKLEELAKIIPQFPQLIALMERKTKIEIAKADGAAKRLKVDFDTAIKTLEIEAKRESDRLKFEADRLSGVISAIGSDTPERLGAQLALTQTVLQEQYNIIDQQSNAALKRAQTAREMALKAGQAPAQVAKQFAEKTEQIELERSRSKELLAQKTALEEQGRQIQYNLQLTERQLQTEVERLQAQKSLILGTGLGSESAKIELDRQIRERQRRIAEAQDQANIDRDIGTRNLLLKQAAEKYGGEDMADREMTASERLQIQALDQVIEKSRNINKERKITRDLTEFGARAQEDFNYRLKEQEFILAKNQLARTQQALEAEKIFDADNENLAISKELLDYQANLGFIRGDQLKQANAKIEKDRIELQLRRDLLANEQEILSITERLEQARIRALGGVTKDDQGNIMPGTDSPETIGMEAELAKAKAAGDKLRLQAARQVGAVERDLLRTDRMEEYSKKFTGFFDSMGDAIANWAATGKWNGKELVNSLIQDLLRYEMRLQMHALFVQGLKPLIGNFFSNLNFGSGIGYGSQDLGQYFAKGGAFDTMGSVPGYAKGGMFTNKVVDKPTFFMAAKGLGVMGEAGPEAIMPLRRDKSGKLGIMTFAQGDILPLGRNDNGDLAASISGTNNSSSSNTMGNTTINVHNYTGKEVNTQESTDARGNRRIEVTVGEMVGAEVSRVGGAPRQSINATYGLKPLLIRR